MVEVTPAPLTLAQWSDEELRAELTRGLTLTAQHLTRLGLVWVELERRGRDLSDLREGLAEWLPRIATGRLAAEAVVAFATRRLLLRALDGVPLERQRALAAGELVAVIDPTNPDAVISAPLARLPALGVRLVFHDGEVRTPQAQRLALRPRPRKKVERHYRPVYDRDQGTVRIGRMTLRMADLLAEVVADAGPDLPVILKPDEYVTVRLRLTPEEQRRLQEAAKRAELPDWELTRKALRAFGLI